MGNTGKGTEKENSQEHDRLGVIRIEKQQPTNLDDKEDTGRDVMYLKKTVETEKAYGDWLKDLKQIQDTQTRQTLLLPEKYEYESVGMCGSNGLAKLKFEYFQYGLKTEIQNRRNMHKEFLETEVWYLLYNMVRAAAKFEHLKKKLGDIQPSNILINDDGMIKLISTASFPGQQTNYQKLCENPQEKVYLAPEECNADLIQKGNYPSHVDPCLAQVFSIGLTVLSASTLQDCSIIYNLSPIKMDQQKLQGLVKILQQKYSAYLYQTVTSMLALNPLERKKASSLYSQLQQYENSIMDLEPFLPQKAIHQQQQAYQHQVPAQNYEQNRPYGGPRQQQPPNGNNYVNYPQVRQVSYQANNNVNTRPGDPYFHRSFQ